MNNRKCYVWHHEDTLWSFLRPTHLDLQNLMIVIREDAYGDINQSLINIEFPVWISKVKKEFWQNIPKEIFEEILTYLEYPEREHIFNSVKEIFNDTRPGS